MSLGRSLGALRAPMLVPVPVPALPIAALSHTTRTFAPKLGDVFSETRLFTADDVASFASLTHDTNPMHADAVFAESGRFGQPVVHGMLYACMFGAIVGQRFPGAVYLHQSLTFKKPVFVGDSITAEIELLRIGGAGRVLEFATRCSNRVGDIVLSGDARVLMPRLDRATRGKCSGT